MRDRIARHQAERGTGWSTVEAPLEIATAITAQTAADPSPAAAIVVDCLTLWLSNLLAADRDVEAATDALITALAATPADVILVSNEVGLGIVPANALARSFRDAQGRLNQRLAATVDHVDFVAAGLTLNLKPGPSS